MQKQAECEGLLGSQAETVTQVGVHTTSAVARLDTDAERKALLTAEVLLVVRHHLVSNGLVGSVVLDDLTDIMDLMELGMDSTYLTEVSVRLETLTGCPQRGPAFVRPNLPVQELVMLALSRFHLHHLMTEKLSQCEDQGIMRTGAEHTVGDTATLEQDSLEELDPPRNSGSWLRLMCCAPWTSCFFSEPGRPDEYAPLR